MSTGPARLSRRSLLRGAASVTVLAALASVSSCAEDPAGVADAPDGASPLLRLGRSIAVDGHRAGSGASTPPPRSITTDPAAVAAIDGRGDVVRADFAAGSTVVAAGWLLAATEADVLTAYADACPSPSC